MNYWDNRYNQTLQNGSTGMMKANGNDSADNDIFSVIKLMLDGKTYESAFDFGCGLGNKIPFLESIGCKRIYGFDVSNVALDVARKRYPMYGFVEDPTFIEGVDLIYAHFVFQHVMDDCDLFSTISLLRVIGKEMIVIDNVSDKPDLSYMRFRSESKHEDIFSVTGWEECSSAIIKIGDEYAKIWRLR